MSANNPAARLHEIFSTYASHRAGAKTGSIVGVWDKTLGASEPVELRARLMQVIALVDQVGRQLQALEKPAYLKMYRDVAPVLLECLVLPDIGTSTQLGDDTAMIYTEQLNALGALAAVLEDGGPDVPELSEDTLTSFREQLTAALDAIRADRSLPAPVRRSVIARLHEILWALDHLDTVGPEEVIAAAERIGFLWEHLPQDQRTPSFTKAMQTAAKIWATFIGASETVQAVETFHQVIELTQH
jgi:hypothetical protein